MREVQHRQRVRRFRGHTAAPVAERRLAIVKLGSLKLWRTAQKTGLQVTQHECVSESAMATNLMLSYGGYTPCQSLLGNQPRELYDFESDTVSAYEGVLETTPDFIETSIRLRMHAKDCILQSIWEDRLAKAEGTRSQQHKAEDLDKLIAGAKIDIWREPDQLERARRSRESKEARG